MNRKTQNLTLSALFSALTLVSLYIASIWPTGQLSLAAFASIFTAAAVIESGINSGCSVFVVSSALGLLILPDKGAPLVYILFFGYYPIAKSLIEKMGSVALQWILKLALFNASLTVIWFFLRWLIFDQSDTTPATVIVYLAGSAIFALYDYGFSKVIRLYINRVPRLKK